MATSKGQDVIALADAAKLLMLTGRRIQQLVSEGYIQKLNGKYTVVGVVQGYIKYLQDENRRTSKSAASSRVTDRRADEIELRIMERQETLLKDARDEALGIIDRVIGGLKGDMYSIPARVTGDLVQRRKIEVEIDNAFGEAAKRAQDCASGVDKGS